MENRLQAELERTHTLRRGMRADMADAAYTRWLAKPVHEAREIPLAARFDDIRMVGLGHLGLEAAGGRSGGDCLTLAYRAVQPIQHPAGRAYSTAEVFVPMGDADLRAYNRVSIWVYVDSDNNATTHMALYLRNKGPRVMPVPGRFEGYQTETLPAKQWTRVLWEIPDVDRNCVSSISISFQASGTSYPGDTTVRCRLDCLQMEQVELDSDKGFALREGAIAYCHSGYRLGTRKQALVQGHSGAFSLPVPWVPRAGDGQGACGAGN